MNKKFSSPFILFFLLGIITPCNGQNTKPDLELSSLTKLRKRMIELKKISSDKQQQIEEKERIILSLSSRSERLKRDNSELSTTIRTQTEKVFKLRSELSDLLSEYNKTIQNLNQVETEKIG